MTTRDVPVRPLPEPVELRDLDPKFNPRDPRVYDKTFDLWLVAGMGWVIPTLHISNASRRQAAAGVTGERTYAVSVETERSVRVGLGPHVLQRLTVYVRESRLEAMRPLLDLKLKGEIEANTIRDQISTRRMRRHF